MTKHNGVISTAPPPQSLHLDPIDLALAVSNGRHKPRPNRTAYVQADVTRKLAESCEGLIELVENLTHHQRLTEKQRYVLVKSWSALRKARHVLRSQE